jgi:hypothetical protein
MPVTVPPASPHFQRRRLRSGQRVDESGFSVGGRVHSERSPVLSSFYARRRAVLRHRELTERIIGLAIEGHRHTDPRLGSHFTPPRCAGSGNAPTFGSGMRLAFRRGCCSISTRFVLRIACGASSDDGLLLRAPPLPSFVLRAGESPA